MELEVIGDRYELQDSIGRGGMATIFRAADLRMGRIVAVKILREVYSSDPKFVTRFQREARAASALQHPNIVQVFDYGQSGESYYIVMEFIDGMDLRRYLKRAGVLKNERAVEIAHDVALGLGAAHRRGIVHRDVKPQNVLLNDDNVIKLTDFGIASMYKDAEAERLTTTGMTLGTVQYYAPEQAQGEIVSPAADIYALGIVLYEMLTGRTPFDGDTPVAVAMRHIQDAPQPPRTLNPEIAPALERIIMRCLEKDPRDRFPDGDALAYALENVVLTPARRTGVGVPNGHGQFAAPGLLGVEGRPPGPPRGSTMAPSGPRGASITSQPRQGGRYLPPIDDYDRDVPGLDNGYPRYAGDAGISTKPYGPAGGTSPRITGPNGMPSRPGEPNGKGNGPIIAAVVGGVVLLLLLGCGLVLNLTGGISGILAAFSSPTPVPTQATTSVPSFLGMKCADAQTLARTKHLQVTCTNKASDQPVGIIFNQSPAANSTQAWNANVSVDVSAGPAKVKVPNLIQPPVTQAEACTLLADAKLNCGSYTFQPSTTVAQGRIIQQSKPPNTEVDPGTIIDLVISSGAPQPTVTPTPSPTATPSGTVTPTPTPKPVPSP